MSTHRYRAATAAIAAVTAAALLASCSDDNGKKKSDPPSTPTTSTTSADVPTPTPTTTVPKTPEDIAGEQAVALAKNYFKVIDDTWINPEHAVLTNARALNEVAIDQALDTNIRAFNMIIVQRGGKQSGHVKVVWAKAGFTNLTYKPDAKPQVLPTVTVNACIDVRTVTLVDRKGRSLVQGKRPPYYTETLTVKNFKYPSPSTWRVAIERNKEASSCRLS